MVSACINGEWSSSANKNDSAIISEADPQVLSISTNFKATLPPTCSSALATFRKAV
eukprot:CAMPEP_0204194670 /NCGR_PEP_ID=MMETSP0361-20130328/62530_1 /ASSEMBLY_ACC=CAM_ASM_000343 /TAXON_ID=268821 /ORGANISM="Scrippsiella Hangoei, Strain SHTV-5" /LENGTH=55 /DNA_ID=CAMNT_0051156083 /DNA_START=314 /DNA_END=478 /DNA_ORIENTATION=+